MSLATLTFNNILINEGQSTVLDSANFDVQNVFNEGLSGGRFIVDKVSGGHFTLNGKVSKYFTQSELDLGLVKFVDNGNEFSPYFSIRYIGADGVTASNSIRFSAAGDSNSNQFNTFNDLADVDVRRLTFKAYDADPTFGVTLKSSSVLSTKQLKISDPDSNKNISYGEHGIRITIVDSTEYTLEHYVKEEGVSSWTEAAEGVTYNEVSAGKVRFTWNGDAADSNIQLLVTDSSLQGTDNTQVVTLFTRFDAVRTGGNIAEQLGREDYTPEVVIALRNGRTTLTPQQLQLFERQDSEYVELSHGTGKDSGYLYTVSSVKGGYFELKDSRTVVENGDRRTDDTYVKTSSFTLADLAAGNVVFHSTGADNISWKAKVRDPGGLTSGNYNFSGQANSAPEVNDASLILMVAEDTTTSSRIIATDREGDVLTYSLSDGTLSNGNYTFSTSKGNITLNANTGFYSYNPKLDATGSDSFTVIVSDNNSSTQVKVAVTITPFDDNTGSGSFDKTASETDLSIVGPTPASEGYIYSIQGHGTSWSNTGLGGWGVLTINASTGIYTLNKTAAPDFFGDIDFTIVATKNGQAVLHPTTITITNVNDAPVFAISYDSKDAYLDTDFALVINRATDADLNFAASTEVLTYTAKFNAADLPWLTFDPDTRTFSGKPSGSDKSGAFDVMVTVTDTANVSVSDSFKINVKGLPGVPWASTLNAATTITEAGNMTTMAVADNLKSGWLNEATGSSATQDPALLQVASVANSQTVAGDPINSDAFYQTSYFQVSVGNDLILVKPDGTWKVKVDHGTWQHLSQSETATISFTYKVTDLNGSGNLDDVLSYDRLVKITITGVDDQLTALDDSATVLENSPGLVTVAANQGVLINDTDIDTHDQKYVQAAKLSTVSNYSNVDTNPIDGLSAIALSIQGKYGSLSIKADGSYTYTVDNTDTDTKILPAGDVVQEFFDLRIGTYYLSAPTAGVTGGSDTSTLTISITGQDDLPTLIKGTEADPYKIDSHGQGSGNFDFTIKFTEIFTDLDGNEGELLSITNDGQPVNYTPSSNDNNSFDPADNFILSLQANNNLANGVGSTLLLSFDNTGDQIADYSVYLNINLWDSQVNVP